MTGATYARLPKGPQLNNYRDLVDLIREADETRAESLTSEEKRIITRVSKAFSQKQMMYQAVHDEKIWKKRTNGAIIPYTDADELRAL